MTSELERINAYWRAANYLSVGQIYLHDNPLIKNLLSRSISKECCSDTGVQLPDRILFMFI